MHELSIAMSIVQMASEEAERRNARVVAVHLKLGLLAGVVKNALLSAYELAREGSPVAESQLVIQTIPVAAWCPECRAAQPIESIQRLCCPTCGTATGEILSGRELEVSALEVLDGEYTNSGSAAECAQTQ